MFANPTDLIFKLLLFQDIHLTPVPHQCSANSPKTAEAGEQGRQRDKGQWMRISIKEPPSVTCMNQQGLPKHDASVSSRSFVILHLLQASSSTWRSGARRSPPKSYWKLLCLKKNVVYAPRFVRPTSIPSLHHGLQGQVLLSANMQIHVGAIAPLSMERARKSIEFGWELGFHCSSLFLYMICSRWR